MIIMKTDATQSQIDFVIQEIARFGLRADVSKGDYKTIIGLVGDERKIPFAHFAILPGVKEAIPVETPYKLISREYSKYFRGPSEDKHIKIGNISIGGSHPVYIAGPCAVESKGTIDENSRRRKESGRSCFAREVSSSRVHQSILFRDWADGIGKKLKKP